MTFGLERSSGCDGYLGGQRKKGLSGRIWVWGGLSKFLNWEYYVDDLTGT